MSRRNNLIFLAVLILFVLSTLMVFPVFEWGVFGKEIRLGLDLQGGTRIVYQADLSSVAAGKGGRGNVALLEFGELVTGNETFKWENSLGRWKASTAAVDGVEKELTSRYFIENEDVFVRPVSTGGGIELVFRWHK